MENSIKSVCIQIRFRSVSRCRRLVSFSLAWFFFHTLLRHIFFFLLFCILSLWLSYHKNAQANYKLDESGSDVVLVAGDVFHSLHSISSFFLTCSLFLASIASSKKKSLARQTQQPRLFSKQKAILNLLMQFEMETE